jgi:hypothetical protein
MRVLGFQYCHVAVSTKRSPIYRDGIYHLFRAELQKSVSIMHDDWRSNGGCASARLGIMDNAMKMKSRVMVCRQCSYHGLALDGTYT